MYSLYDNTSRYWVPPFGNLRIIAYLLLPEAFRGSSRPSSASSAKAFTMRPFLLDLFQVFYLEFSLSRSLFQSVFTIVSVFC